MQARALLLAGLLALMPLAGCLGADEEAPAPAAVNNTSDNSSFAIPDGRSGGAAYEETNVTEDGVGGMEHDHDYWQGRTRVDIFQTSAYMRPAPSTSGTWTEIRVPQPGLVFEGTAKVEVTISNPQRHACEWIFTFPYEYWCTSNGDEIWVPTPSLPTVPDPKPPQDLTLQYKHAATNEWIDVGNIQWETPLEIPVTDPTWTDMPHATASLWMFRVVSPNPEDATLKFDASGAIVKGDKVEMWPGHPDFYADTPVRKVFEGSAQTVDRQAWTGPITGPDVGETIIVQPQKLISWGTKAIHVFVNITNVNGATTPTSWFVEYHNATGGWQLSDRLPSGETSYYWAFPVDDNGMDTPYADGSRWEFTFGGAYANCVGGCADYSVKYDMAILATSQPLPDAPADG